ncbi:MAG: hypothetical protein ACR2O8_03035 [Rhizobiaceae bacterium]
MLEKEAAERTCHGLDDLLDDLLERIGEIQTSHPGNKAIQSFDPDYYHRLSPQLQKRLLDCMRSGIQNPDSDMGCYARFFDDYEILNPFFAKVIARHHGENQHGNHCSDWHIKKLGNNPQLDISRLGLPLLSLRIRVGRNFNDLPLTSAMKRSDRLNLEDRMVQVFDQLQSQPGLSGTYGSLTPGHANQLSKQEHQTLIKDHIMFKDMDSDPYLAAAGIAGDWPFGRGCYYSYDRKFVVWVGEEDHLRIMYMDTATSLKPILDKLHSALKAMENASSGEFAFSSSYGFVTTCPTNLGTGMRASAHIQLPNLTKDGSVDRVREIADPIGLSVRGLGGEHTPIGQDGTVDISPRARLYVTEGQIVSKLFDGLKLLKEAEDSQG